MKCLNCGVEFESKRKDAKYHSDACRLQAHRGEVVLETDSVKRIIPETDNETVSASVKTTATFTPNWKRLGFESKEKARMFVLATLAEESTRLAGFDSESTWIINGRTVILKKGKFLEVDARL